MVAGCRCVRHRIHDACLVMLAVASFCQCGSSATNPRNSCGSGDEERLQQEATPQEVDDASLLQVTISASEEHQADEAEKSVAVTKDGMLAGKANVEAVSSQRQTQRKAVEELALKTRMMAESLLLKKIAMQTRMMAESLLRNGGDSALITLAIIFIGLVIVACCIIACIIGPVGEDKKGATQSGQRPDLVRHRQYSSPLDSRRQPRQEAAASASMARSSHGKQPYQGSPEFASTAPNTQTPASTAPNTQIPATPFSTSGLQSGSIQGGLPLCYGLVVPDGSRLACVVRSDVRRTKQSLSFNVRSVDSRGGAGLFKVDVQEKQRTKLGIYLKALDGSQTLAYLSTEEFWAGPEGSPALGIYRANGALFGTVQKNASGGYIVMRGQTSLMAISGDFVSHQLKATASNGRVIATTSNINENEYQAHIQSRVDAGLILLALLAADKMELAPGIGTGGTTDL